MRIGKFELIADSSCFTLQEMGVCTDIDSDNFGKDVKVGSAKYYTSAKTVAIKLRNEALKDAIEKGDLEIERELKLLIGNIKKEAERNA